MLDIILLSILKITGVVGAVAAVIACLFLLVLFVITGIIQYQEEFEQLKGGRKHGKQ